MREGFPVSLKDLFRRWRALTNKKEMDSQLDDEMRFHLERDIEENIKSGMTPEDARYAALKSFGGVDQSKEQCRDARGVGADAEGQSQNDDDREGVVFKQHARAV